MKADLYLRTGAVAYANVMSQYTDTYLYYLNYREDGSEDRAYHGIEIPMVFNNESPADQDTTLAVQQAWLNFARTGDPNCPELNTTWTRYNTTTHDTMLMGTSRAMVQGYHQKDMDTLLPLLAEYRAYPAFAALCGTPTVRPVR